MWKAKLGLAKVGKNGGDGFAKEFSLTVAEQECQLLVVPDDDVCWIDHQDGGRGGFRGVDDQAIERFEFWTGHGDLGSRRLQADQGRSTGHKAGLARG